MAGLRTLLILAAGAGLVVVLQARTKPAYNSRLLEGDGSEIILSDLDGDGLKGLDPYIFTKYLASSWTNLLQLAQGMDYQWQPEVWKMLALSGVYAVVTFGAGLVIFVRGDQNH
jgi:hypothetical protein